MESILETLNPRLQKFPAFSSYTPRRSHLDSVSYRSLVRILSCCLDPPPSPAERTLDVNGGSSMERRENGGGEEGGLGVAAELVGIDNSIFDDEFEGCVNSDLLSRLMSDCEKLIDVSDVELRSSGELDKDLVIMRTCNDGVVEGGCSVKEVSEVAKGDADSERSNVMPDSDSLIGERSGEIRSIVQSNEEIVDNDLGISKVCVHGAVPRDSDLEEGLKVSKEDDNNKLLSTMLPNKIIDAPPTGELCSSGELHEVNEEADRKQIVEKGFMITKAFTKRDANNEMFNRFTSDCNGLIDAPNRKLHLTFELHDGNGQSVREEIAGNGPEITKGSVHEEVGGNDPKITKASVHEEIAGNDPDIAKASVHEEIAGNNPEIIKASVFCTKEEFHSIVEIPEVFKGDGNHAQLNKVILDGSRLIDAPKSNDGSHDRNVQAGYNKIVNNDLISNAFVYGAKDGNSDLGKVLEVSKEDELGRIQHNVPEVLHSSMKESEGRRKTTGDAFVDVRIKVAKQTTYANCPSLMDWTGVRNLEENQVNTFANKIDEVRFEEGEIPNEIQDLEGQIDFNDEERVQGPRSPDFKDVASTFVHKEDVLGRGTGYHPSTVEGSGADVNYEANPSDTSEKDSADEETPRKQMVMNAKVKRQRGPMTEEKKARKKIAKKRKRAQKNREQGVKKLKLHTITKPKEVKICNFYLMGRCQQGDLCKYSHDAPLVKSAPCKYFATNSCLKGDDCMFDHELSKYPCNKFVTTGSCIRGDGCKFSHKIPATEASSQLTSGKIESHLTSEPPKLKNQPVRAHVFSRATGPFESNNKGTPSLGRTTPLKEATQVPKGVRFLSFGAEQTDLNSKVKENLPVKKSGKNGVYNQQRQDDLFVASSGSAASSNGFAIKNSCNLSSVTAPGTANHEVSEAAKILEEFLFCGTT